MFAKVYMEKYYINAIKPLTSPHELMKTLPLPIETVDFIVSSRKTITNIINGTDDRLLVIIGPCSIHDPKSALDYTKKLIEISKKHTNQLFIVMRTYFEKPRTTIGWKGLISDPLMNETHDINQGLFIARNLLIQLNQLGMPAATEFLDPINSYYIKDLVSWGAIGARTTESQTHRELASSLPCAVGFKNNTDGNVQVAIDAITSAKNSHTYSGINNKGQAYIQQSTGNPDSHIILRGGKKPNYHFGDIDSACTKLKAFHHQNKVMVDCSHGNSQKDHYRQIEIAHSLGNQISQGSSQIFGLMIESFLVAGKQNLQNITALRYGQSVTDACIGIEESEDILSFLAQSIDKRRVFNKQYRDIILTKVS
jgi:3-deoxy-7-phosphoheptulonate synthase